MIGVLESEDVARELDDRVLKAASRSEERHPRSRANRTAATAPSMLR
jgi:hypothetical protein